VEQTPDDKTILGDAAAGFACVVSGINLIALVRQEETN